MRIVIYIFLCLFISSNLVLSYENKILVKVNNEIITTIDLLNEIEYLTLFNQNYKKFNQEQMIELSKNSLIREKIKKIELKKNFKSMNINETYFSNIINNYIKRFNLNSFEEFDEYLKVNNIKFDTFKKKISIEILWNRLIYEKFNKSVKIDEQKIRKEVLSQEKKRELLLSEILFNIENRENLEIEYQKIVDVIQEKNFETAASLFSIADTSKNGGKIGWVNLSALNKEIKKNLQPIKNNKITKPITVPGGFLILKIDDNREVENKDNIQDQLKLITNQIINEQLNQHSIIYFNKIKKNIKINEL